jgi:acylglycerol lipase
MRHDEGAFTGAGGLSIFRQAWLPDGDARAVVLLAHGASEHSGRYVHVGEAFAAAGFATHALDHRGHGRSEGPRALLDRMDNAVADLHVLRSHAAERHPAVPVFLLGHSMGGTVALRYVRDHEAGLAGLILSAPLAALEAASPATRLAAKVLSAVTPRLGVVDIDASGVSRDPAVVADYESDPLNHHGRLPARTVAEITAAIEDFPEDVRRIRIPLLIVAPGADRLVPGAAAEMVHENSGSADKTIERYPDLYHESFNEPERDEVIAKVVAWMQARVT